MIILVIMGVAILLTPAAALVAAAVTQPTVSNPREHWQTLVPAGALLAGGLIAMQWVLP